MLLLLYLCRSSLRLSPTEALTYQVRSSRVSLHHWVEHSNLRMR